MGAETSADGGMSRPEKVWLGGCLLLLIAVAVAMVWGVLTRPPIDEDDYARVQLGMSKGKVTQILGGPDRRYVKTPEESDLRPYPGSSPQEGRATTETIEAATEVWRWSRWLDQRIGVVFDADGKVIFEWLDY